MRWQKWLLNFARSHPLQNPIRSTFCFRKREIALEHLLEGIIPFVNNCNSFWRWNEKKYFSFGTFPFFFVCCWSAELVWWYNFILSVVLYFPRFIYTPHLILQPNNLSDVFGDFHFCAKCWCYIIISEGNTIFICSIKVKLDWIPHQFL